MEEVIRGLKFYKSMVPIYGIMLLFSFHYFILLYINSSNLEQYWSQSAIGNLYTYGSIITIAIFIFSARIISRVHAYGIFIAFLALETCASIILSLSHTQYLSGVGFLILQASAPLLFFAIDIYLSQVTKGSKHTGNVRSILLTITSFTVVVSPLISVALIETYSFSSVYIVSLAFLLPVFFLGQRYLHPIKIEKDKHLSMRKAILSFKDKPDLRYVYIANLILKIFYAIMTIYLPIYLHKYIGFDWSQIGIILTIMLLPFLIFEIPFGIIADKWLGEKEIMVAGFVISGLSVWGIFLFPDKNIFVISLLLFMSRIGASGIETMTEAYFFKKMRSNQIDLISFFRTTNPLSFIIAPILVLPIIISFSEPVIFLELAIITLLGVIPALLIKDTK